MNEETLLIENEQLKSKVQFLEEILNHAPTIIYINQIDEIGDMSTGRNVWVNRRGLDLIGLTQKEIDALGSEFFTKVLHPDDMELTSQSIFHLKVQPEEDVYMGLCRLKAKDGEYIWTHFRTCILKRKPDGTPWQYISIASEFSEQMHSDKQLVAALKEINRLKHEINLKSISKREGEVLKLVVQGLTDRDIAERLFISERTAQTHRSNLIKKMGAKNTASLVALAVESGISG